MSDTDWRSKISEFDTLDDLDPLELTIYLRHQYLKAAKDLIKHPNDKQFAFWCTEMAMSYQAVLDVHDSLNIYLGRSYYDG